MEVFDHAAQVVLTRDRDRYVADLFASPNARKHLFALHAFDLEIARVAKVVSEPALGEIRLQWWRDALAAGEGAGNPLLEAVLETLRAFALPSAALDMLIEARISDLYDDPMPTFEALEGYVRHTSTTMFDLAARICGGQAEEASVRAGMAYGITALLRSFALHASRRQLFVPLDAPNSGATPEQIFAGQPSAGLVNALGVLRSRARENLTAFEALLPQLPAATMPALLPVAVVPGYLSVMEQPGYDPFRTPVEVPQWRRQWGLWRAARRYARRMRG
jgi:phytoene synthase